MALRSRRLENLFGCFPFHTLTARHVRGLVESGAQEAFAGDVAALANTAGGAIVIGIEEDDQARAASAPGIEITDGKMARIRQVVASLTAPMPTLDIIPLFDDEPQNERGFSSWPYPAALVRLMLS